MPVWVESKAVNKVSVVEVDLDWQAERSKTTLEENTKNAVQKVVFMRYKLGY